MLSFRSFTPPSPPKLSKGNEFDSRFRGFELIIYRVDKLCTTNLTIVNDEEEGEGGKDIPLESRNPFRFSVIDNFFFFFFFLISISMRGYVQ